MSQEDVEIDLERVGRITPRTKGNDGPQPKASLQQIASDVSTIDQACAVLSDIGDHDEIVLGLLQLKGRLLQDGGRGDSAGGAGDDVSQQRRSLSSDRGSSSEAALGVIAARDFEQQHVSTSEEDDEATEDEEDEGKQRGVEGAREGQASSNAAAVRKTFTVLAKDSTRDDVEYDSEDEWKKYILNENSADMEESESREDSDMQIGNEEAQRKIQSLKSAQLELLQQISIVKKNDRTFKQMVAQILESTMDPAKAVAELQQSFSRMKMRERQQQKTSSLLHDDRTDSEIIGDISHPIEQLTALTRHINVQEATYLVLIYFFRLEGQFSRPANVPLSGVCIHRAFRYWRVQNECFMYPLYSALVSHCAKRLTNCMHSVDLLSSQLTELAFLFFVFRSEDAPDASDDRVKVTHVDHLLLDLNPLEQDGESSTSSEITLPFEQRINTPTSLWLHLRRLVTKAYCGLLKTTYEDLFTATLQQLRELRKGGQTPSVAGRAVTDIWENVHDCLEKHLVPTGVKLQLFRQLFYYVCALLFNDGLLNRTFLSHRSGAVLRGDLDSWEDWIKRRCPEHREAFVKEFTPLTHVLNVIFMKKNLLKRPEVRMEVCPSLNVHQLQQLLMGYTPAPREENVSLALITVLIGETLDSADAGNRVDLSQVLIDVQALRTLSLSIKKRGWMCFVDKEEVRMLDFPTHLVREYPAFRDAGLIPEERK